jgi:hypothetical protein
MFDIVVLLGSHDVNQINQQIEYTKRNIVGYTNIYIVPRNPKIQVKDCIIVPETKFPFTIKHVSRFRKGHRDRRRNRWYLQQLLTLYAGFVIPNIQSTYLVIDADTHFLKPTTFIENGKCLYNPHVGYYHPPYFHHMRRLHPSLERVKLEYSGISHHMMFETKYLRELFNLVKQHHQKEFWRAFLRCIAPHKGPRASEYEIYFNYMLKYHSDKIKIRLLKWKNAKNLNTKEGYDYISCHWHLGKRHPNYR